MTSTLKTLLTYYSSKRDNDENVYEKNAFDESFTIPKKLLRWTSIRMSQNITLPGIYWDLFYWFEFANIFIAVPSEFFGMLMTSMAAESIEDFSKVFRMVPCLGSSVLSMFKSFKIVYNRPVYENLVNELRDMWPQGEVSPAEQQLIKPALKQLSFAVKGYFWCNNVLLMSFLMPPFFITLGRYCGYEAPMNLHFIYWLPFDPIQPVYYEMLLIMQTWHALIVIWWNVAWDMLFCTLLCHLTLQFDLLALRIEKLFPVPADHQLIDPYPLGNLYIVSKNELDIKNTNIEYDNGIDYHKEIRKIILRHIALIRLSNDMEKMCGLTLLVNFLNGSIIICFCGFSCVAIEKWSDIAYKSFLVTTLSQNWLLCWYGQKLIDSSLSIGKAVYSCGWYNASQKIKMLLLVILHRAQRSTHVTTYGFSVVSLDSYSKIVQTSWTYFTLIMNFYKS